MHSLPVPSPTFHILTDNSKVLYHRPNMEGHHLQEFGIWLVFQKKVCCIEKKINQKYFHHHKAFLKHKRFLIVVRHRGNENKPQKTLRDYLSEYDQ